MLFDSLLLKPQDELTLLKSLAGIAQLNYHSLQGHMIYFHLQSMEIGISQITKILEFDNYTRFRTYFYYDQHAQPGIVFYSGSDKTIMLLHGEFVFAEFTFSADSLFLSYGPEDGAVPTMRKSTLKPNDYMDFFGFLEMSLSSLQQKGSV